MEILNKTQLIEKIQTIIENWGSVNSAELNLDCSPCYASVGNSVSLVERFNRNDVDIVTNFDGQEIDEFSKDYEELEQDLLTEILDILENYDVDMQKIMDSCKDENF